MILLREQARLFYRIWIPLLDFVNQKKEIDKSLFGMTSPEGLPISSLKPIRDALWGDRELLDEYIELKHGQLTNEEQSVIAGWKNAICDSFVVLRHLKSGSIVLPIHNTSAAYIVRGIYSSWDEVLMGAALPTLVTTTLIPFAGVIICDSIMIAHHMQLVGNEKRSMEELYRRIKTAGGVQKSLG